LQAFPVAEHDLDHRRVCITSHLDRHEAWCCGRGFAASAASFRHQYQKLHGEIWCRRANLAPDSSLLRHCATKRAIRAAVPVSAIANPPAQRIRQQRVQLKTGLSNAYDAVTFRLRWQMAVGRMQGDRMSLEFSDAFPRPDEIELTLRPGESWLVYTLRNIHRYWCGGTSSIRVSVDNYPWEEDERRLVVADLWLVERLSNGSEAQPEPTALCPGSAQSPVPVLFRQHR
jgi:hypothetical protein